MFYFTTKNNVEIVEQSWRITYDSHVAYDYDRI